MINQYVKPINIDINGVRRINWTWVFQRAPILALGIDSSYNVAKFSSLGTSSVVMQVISGVTFDLIFVGMIALVDQFRSEKRSSNILFWVINIGAMLLSAIFGTLAYSSGSYALVTAESFTRGVAFPILGLLYNLFYHSVTSEIAADKRSIIKRANDEAEQNRKELEAFPYECEFCKKRFETYRQKNGHLARCQLKSS